LSGVADGLADPGGRPTRLFLVATITVRREEVDAFRSFERAAAAVMAKYGGAIERAIVVDDGSAPLQEIHVVSFPDEQAFAAYRADEGLGRLAPLRERSVIRTEIARGHAGPDYSAEL
jgi:hypothetical protein